MTKRQASDSTYDLPFKLRLAIPASSVFLRFALGTSRIRYIGREHEQRLQAEGRRIIYSFWHYGILIPVYTHRGRDIYVLSSMSKDGELTARFIDKFGFRTIRGSTSRGGIRALVGMKRMTDKGYDTAFTPDGPRGPVHSVQGGVVALSKMSGNPILPAGFALSRCWRVNSWDRLKVPKPFGRVMTGIVEPLFVGPDDDEEAACEELKRRLLEADRIAEEGLANW